MTPFDIAIALAVQAATVIIADTPPPPPPPPVVALAPAVVAYPGDTVWTEVESKPTPPPAPLESSKPAPPLRPLEATTPVNVPTVEPLSHVAYTCGGQVLGLGSFILSEPLAGQDPWAPVRGREDCTGIPGYETAPAVLALWVTP